MKNAFELLISEFMYVLLQFSLFYIKLTDRVHDLSKNI